ncbi:MAG: hypothetical protein ACRYFA_11340 [Janthinobacterium lividum]
METPVQTTDLLLTAIDMELKLLLQAEVTIFKTSKQVFQIDKDIDQKKNSQ